MNKVALEEIWPVMQEQIENGKTVCFGPKGTSMMPLLRQNIDSIVLAKAPEKLKKYDLPLYRRDNGHFVLHRVVGLEKDGYIMCGDNQCVYEHGITDKNILAIAVGMYRDKEYVSFDNKKYIRYTHTQVRKKKILRFKKKFIASILSFSKKIKIYPLYRKIKSLLSKKV